MDTFLTPEEVATLTGYQQPARQWDKLVALGFLPAGRGRGHPVTVARAAVEAGTPNIGPGIDGGGGHQHTDGVRHSPDLSFQHLRPRRR